MPGPAPLPTAVLQQRGSWRAAARIRAGEPAPKPGTPSRPRWLSKAAKKYWDDISEQLQDMGVLTTADGTALALLCDALAIYVQCKTDIETRGLLVPGRENTMVKNPSFQFMADARETILRVSKEFGLTPSSRAGLAVSTPNKTDDIESRFFAAG